MFKTWCQFKGEEKKNKQRSKGIESWEIGISVRAEKWNYPLEKKKWGLKNILENWSLKLGRKATLKKCRGQESSSAEIWGKEWSGLCLFSVSVFVLWDLVFGMRLLIYLWFLLLNLPLIFEFILCNLSIYSILFQLKFFEPQISSIIDLSPVSSRCFLGDWYFMILSVLDTLFDMLVIVWGIRRSKLKGNFPLSYFE